jgi:hypothetical protein
MLSIYILKNMLFIDNSVWYTPHNKNVVFNIKNRTLIGLASYMLINAHLFKRIWGKDLLTTNYLQNKSFT